MDPDFIGTHIPGPKIEVYFVLSDGGHAIRTVLTSLKVGGAVEPALIQTEGHKLERLESR